MSSPTPNRADIREPHQRRDPAAALAAAPAPRPPWRERHPIAALVLPDAAALLLLAGGALAVVLGLAFALGWLGLLVAVGLLAVAGGMAIARRPGPRLLDLAGDARAREPEDGRWPAPAARAGAPRSPYAGS